MIRSSVGRTIFSGLVLCGALATTACSGGEAAPATPPAAGGGRGAAQVVPVTTAAVVQRAVPLTIEGIGTVIAASTVAVHSQITGELKSVNFVEGDEVQEGQVIVTLDKRPLEAALNQAEATLQRDLAQAANARAQATRYKDLLDRGIATHEQVDQMVTNAAALDATVASDRANVESAKVQLDYATIRAPLTGKTGLLQVHPGNLVRAGDAGAIVTINKITPVYVSFSIPEARLPDLKRYMARGKLSVIAEAPNDDQPSVGTINFVDNAVDITTGQIKIKGTFPNTDRRLWPGQFVNATVTLSDEANAIVAPSVAIQTGQQGTYAFVVKADQTVELRNVTVERTSGDDSVIKSGLKPGEVVVTDGVLRLVPGTKVSIKNDAAPKATS
jgi:membrane fusion protein, multidrug efflux system